MLEMRTSLLWRPLTSPTPPWRRSTKRLTHATTNRNSRGGGGKRCEEALDASVAGLRERSMECELMVLMPVVD